MLCPKCYAQLDDDSRFCKQCGAATDAVALQREKKRYSIGILIGILMFICGTATFICGFKMALDPVETIGSVLIGASGMLIGYSAFNQYFFKKLNEKNFPKQ